MKIVRSAQTSGATVQEALDDINERMLDKEGVGPEAIISAQYERQGSDYWVTVFYITDAPIQ